MVEIGKLRFINGYKPEKGGTYRKERLYERVFTDEFCTSFNRGGLKMNEKLVNEALIASYDIFKVGDAFTRKFGSEGLVFEPVKQERDGYSAYSAMISISIKKYSTFLKGDIIEFMKYCGYSFQPVTRRDEGCVKLFFKPKFQAGDCTEEVRSSCGYVYHMTPKSNINHIMKNGLVPSSKNALFNYNDRIYLFLGNNLTQKSVTLMKTVWKAKGKQDSVVLLIDLEKVPESVRFFTDFDAEESVFTHDNIPPCAIAGSMDLIKVLGKEK